jgi:hypothetical protein
MIAAVRALETVPSWGASERRATVLAEALRIIECVDSKWRIECINRFAGFNRARMVMVAKFGLLFGCGVMEGARDAT